jgi:hypothetical protein
MGWQVDSTAISSSFPRVPPSWRLQISLTSHICCWYVSNVSIIFDATCLFMHHLLCVLLSFVAFLCISGTNLLTICHSVSSCFLLFLSFRKVTQEIFSELDETKAEVPIFPIQDGVQSRDGGGPEGGHTPHSAGHPLAASGPGVGLWSTTWHRPSAYIFSSTRKPYGPVNFPENILQAAAVVDARSGGSRSSSRHPVGEGNHHRRPSSSPCLPPEWCVSSLPWTTGP